MPTRNTTAPHLGDVHIDCDKSIRNSIASITRPGVNLVSYQYFENCEEVRMESASPRAFNVCRGFDFLGELLTTCVAIAPQLVPRSSCECVETETLNETWQMRASSDHLHISRKAKRPASGSLFGQPRL
jgi:hypothetical protein